MNPTALNTNPHKKRDSSFRSVLVWGGSALMVIGLAILAYRGIFNRFWADDWCYNANFRNLGFARTMQGYFDILLYASNRFSLTFFSGVFYKFGLAGVIVLPLLVIVTWVGGLYKLAGNFEKLVGYSLQRIERFFLATLLVYATLFLAPNQFQVLYWRSAVLPYTFPLLSLVFILIVITNHMLEPRKKLAIALFTGSLAFISVGFSEIGGTYILGLLGLLLVLTLIINKRKQQYSSRAVFPLGIAIAAGLASLLILVFCPSNELRRAFSYSEPATIGQLPWLTFTLTIQYIKSYFTGYMLPVGILAAAGGFFGVGLVNATNSQPVGNARNRIIILAVIILSAFLACYAMLVPAAYIEKAIPEEGRAMIIGCFTLTTTTLIVSVVIGRWIGEILRRQSWFTGNLARVTSLILFVGLAAYAARTYMYAIKPIPFFEKRAEVWDERDKMIKDALAQGQGSVDVREIDSYMGVLELHAEPNWVNMCAAEYYGLQEIRATLPWD